jgi:aminoglycoside phosphotransferase (APT) family kinase protein
VATDVPVTLGAAVTPWLRERMGKPALNVVSMTPASNGFSAQTIFAAVETEPHAAPLEIVLRLEHPGREIFLDTDLGRQAELMRALSQRNIPAPSIIGVELDTAQIGRRFIAMHRSPGRNFPQSSSYLLAGWVKELSAEGRTTLWRNALHVLAEINQLDWRSSFQFLSRPQYGAPGLDQYLGWLRAWHVAVLNHQPHPIIDAGIDHLERARPDEHSCGVIWGDSNPNNMLFGDDLSVSAVLDFEAAALGPGEVDLGWWLFMDRRRSHGHQPLAGKPDRQECIAIYEQALRRRVVAIDYFEIMAGVRMALVIAQTVKRLCEIGQLDKGNDAATHNPIASVLAELLHIETTWIPRVRGRGQPPLARFQFAAFHLITPLFNPSHTTIEEILR